MSTLLLDIDEVLLWWDHSRQARGFNDWTDPDRRHFGRYSPDQLKLIKKLFPNIWWHTTWVDKNQANTHFLYVTGFGPFPNAIDQIPNHLLRASGILPVVPCAPIYVDSELFDGDMRALLRNAGWWKLNAVAALLASDSLPGKVLWVDDHLVASWKSAAWQVIESFGAKDRFMLTAPDPVWSRSAIECGAEWLTS